MHNLNLKLWVVSMFILTAVGGSAQIEQNSGRPAENVQVFFAAVESELTALWRTTEADTEIQRLQPQSNSLTIRGVGGCLVLLRDGYVPEEFEVDANGKNRVQLRTFEWKPGVIVTGRITDIRGGPVVGKVSLAGGGKQQPDPERNLCFLALSESGVISTVTDESGVFSLGPVPAGAHHVTIGSDGHETIRRKLVVSGDAASFDLGDVQLDFVAELILSFDLSEVSEDFPFEIELFRENEEGFYYQEDGWISNTKVVLEDDSSLSFTLAPGLYQAKFSKADSDVFFVDQLLLSPGTNFVTLQPLPIVVYGRVSDVDGPIKDAILEFSCSGNSSRAYSGEFGNFEKTLWTATYCSVFVRTPDGRKHVERIDLTNADFGDDRELPVKVPYNTVAGVVVDADSGDVIPGATVSMVQTLLSMEGESTIGTTADEYGRFEFRGARGESAVTRVFSVAEGYMPVEKEVFVSDRDQSPEVVMELPKARGISGVVTGPGGEPIPGAMVACCALNPMSELSVVMQTAVDGGFTLDAVMGMVVFAVAPGYSIGWSQVRDPDDTLRIALAARSNHVRICAVNEDGDEVPGVIFLLSSPTTGVLPMGLLNLDAALNNQAIRTDSSGCVATSSFPQGTYRTWLSTPAGPIEIGVVPIPSYGEVTVHIPDRSP